MSGVRRRCLGGDRGGGDEALRVHAVLPGPRPWGPLSAGGPTLLILETKDAEL